MAEATARARNSFVGARSRLCAWRDVVRARTEVRKLVGEIALQPENGMLIAEIKRAHVAGALITAAGGRPQMVMVAGVRYFD